MRSHLGWLAVSFLAAVAAITATPAHAAWHEARSKHFIIYADGNPNRLRDFALRLEKFDQAARAISSMPDPPIGDGNRLTLFVMPSAADVRQLVGEKNKFLEGFYTGRASGSLAYVAKPKGSSEDFDGESVLYHEYAHHLMMQQLEHAYPQWYVEGYAEFLSTPKFNKNGSVVLGNAPQHRAWGLFYGKSLPLEALIGGTYGDITKLPAEQRESIYGRGWLLVHYLFMEPKRKGQLESYIRLLSDGTEPARAVATALGDLKQLDKELQAYLNRSTIVTLQVPPALLKTGPVEVKPLSPAAAEIILTRARLKMHSDKSEVEPLALPIRTAQARFPDDELLELTLAEAEFKLERYDVAEAAADWALKANPQSTEAMILKGKAMIERGALAEGDTSRQFAEARKLFIAANKLDPEDPEPLMEFFQAFVREGVRPTANAIEALHYASNLAPQDLGLRMSSAVAYLNEGKGKEARETLRPVAYSPHGGAISEAARRMIAQIDSGDVRGALTAGGARPIRSKAQ